MKDIMQRLFPILPFVALAAACHKAPPPPQPMTGPIPAQICAEVKKTLDTLEKSGGVDVAERGEATVEREIWFEMSAEQRDSLARALAFHAGCASGRQSKEQEVSIRGDDGSLLMHRIISTQIDIQNALGGGGGDIAR